MGILSRLFGSGGGGRHVTKKKFKKILADQVGMSPHTVQQIQAHGVSEDRTLKVSFYFYTNTEEKAAALTGALQKKGYSAEYNVPLAGYDTFSITGDTGKTQLRQSMMDAWSEEMSRLGYEYDCEFDGWETAIPPQ